MRFLVDGSAKRLAERRMIADWLIEGQLLTPLTGYKLCEQIFGIDNGAYSGLKLNKLERMLDIHWARENDCLFVAVPDKVGDHDKTLKLWNKYNSMADGYTKAFVLQDGCDKWPVNADAVFVGGTTKFKDSEQAYKLVKRALKEGLHVHVGRVNTFERFWTYHKLGAHTCDGSGFSRYDHMVVKLRDLIISKGGL